MVNRSKATMFEERTYSVVDEGTLLLQRSFSMLAMVLQHLNLSSIGLVYHPILFPLQTTKA